MTMSKPAPSPLLRPGSERCLCSVCDKFFSGITGFDLHRTGPYDGERRCLSAAELEAKKYIEVDGVWQRNVPRPEHWT